MKINKNNYEAFFLDYHEGNLSAEQTAELMLFLEKHPGLKEEFYSFENISLENIEEIKFDGKEQLKQNANEMLFSSYVDRSLSAKQEKELFALLETNPSLKKDFELFQKTKLSPDFSIVFENKQSLKRKERTGIIIPLYRYVAVAASITLIVVLYFLLGNKNSNEGQRFAYEKQGRKPGYIMHKNGTIPVNENNNSVAINNQKKVSVPFIVKKNNKKDFP